MARNKEKSYSELSPSEKRGFKKFAKLNTKQMNTVCADYRIETGRNPFNISEKDKFFKFVLKWRKH